MKKLAKKYAAALKLVDQSKRYDVKEASELVAKTNTTKFDACVQVVFKLNLDTKQPDQQLRGTIALPFGNGKTKKVLAVTNTKVDEAKAAGADYVGGADLLDKIAKENWFDFDVIVATPDMMGQLGKMGRVLGPKGLMPNPKAGTVSMDIGKAITEIKNGKITYRADKDGNIACQIAASSFSADKIAANLQTVIDTIVRVKPASIKGVYIQNAIVHTAMGPSIKLNIIG